MFDPSPLIRRPPAAHPLLEDAGDCNSDPTNCTHPPFWSRTVSYYDGTAATNRVFVHAYTLPASLENGGFRSCMQSRGEVGGTSSPENDRRKILELEFPDDGYNIVCCIFGRLRILAYDTSRMIVSRVNVDVDENVYKVASKIVGVRANLGEGGEDDTTNDKFSVVVEDDDRTGECLLINNKPSGDHIF
ncbi:protein LTV1-like protein [Cucumis melo var. makuwa]|uniref:Protein LTV1-like protein n=1 Tax=Cucumis melo var. makuwa TaxID=1194695 RepID=A0A5A7TQI5_CUCMM|nr:protein LTV1-like protein [Cucumis melo var. makuwa]